MSVFEQPIGTPSSLSQQTLRVEIVEMALHVLFRKKQIRRSGDHSLAQHLGKLRVCEPAENCKACSRMSSTVRKEHFVLWYFTEDTLARIGQLRLPL